MVEFQTLLRALKAITEIPDPKSGDRSAIRRARHIAACALKEAGE
jgi:hypothetical protein